MTLKSCVIDQDKKARLEVGADGVAVVATEADEKFQYAIPYEDMKTWMKETDVTVERYSNGTLKSFNSTVKDQAGPIAMAVVLDGVKIAAAVAVGGVAAPAIIGGGPSVLSAPMFLPQEALKAPAIPDKCDSDAVNDLKIIKDNTKAIKDRQALILKARSTKNVDLIQAQVVQLQAEIDDAKKNTTQKISFRWVPDPLSASPTRFSFPLDSVVSKWVKFGTPAESKSIMVQLNLNPWTVGDKARQSVPLDDGKVKGLVIREPALGTLRVCDTKCKDEPEVIDPKAIGVAVPQLGRLLVLPLANTIFENSTLQVGLNTDGTVATIGSTDNSGAATGVAGLGSAADSYVSGVGYRNTAIGAANTAKAADVQYADTVNKALADCLTQQAAILKAGATPAMSCQ